MEIKEILDFLAENKEAQSAIKEKFSLMDSEDVNGLVNSKKSILEEKKQLMSKLKAFGSYTPEEVQELAEELESLRAGSGKQGQPGGEDKKIIRQIKELENKLADIQKERDTYKSKAINTGKTVLINQVFDEFNVDKSFRKVLNTYFSAQGEAQELENGIDLYYNTEKGEVPLKAFAKSFFESESGKAYIAKPDNLGGGGQGSGSNGNSKTMPRSQFNSLLPAERDKVMSEGVTLTDQ